MTETFDTLADAATEGPFAPHLVDLKPVGTMPAHFVELRYPAGRYAFTRRPEFSLSRTIRIDKPGRIENEFRRRDPRRYLPGDLELAVPETSSVWSTDGETHLVMMSLPPTKVETLLEGHETGFRGDFGALHEDAFRSEPTLTLFDQLWQNTRPGCATNTLLVDGLFMALVAQLIYLSQAGGRPKVTPGDTLTQKVMDRVDDFISASADTDLRMKDLADAAGLPQARFARAFKKTTGQTPYQYVLQHRLSKAQEMIRTSPQSLAQISFSCGFSSQAHMTDVFRSKLGITPGLLRKH